MIPRTWSDLEAPLVEAWHEATDRDGSFADAPCEPGENFDATLGPVWPLEHAAHEAVKTWIETGTLPPMPPAANRYAEIQFICAIGFVRRLSELPNPSLPPEWPLPKLLQWLLFDVHADTVQVALDSMRTDLLGGRE